jgi:hypothetical protein
MKKLITLLTGMVCLFFLNSVPLNAQWAFNGIHIYNTNAGNVGIVTNVPGKLLDVAKNTTEPTIRVYNLGGMGGATYQMTDLISGADWKFKATNIGGFKIRDNAMGLDVFTIEQNAAANAIYIKQGGNVGLGLNNPLEKLHINGALIIGNTANNNPGTIRWDGSNFQGRKAAGWVNLDVQNDNDWLIQPNIPFGNPELVPVAAPSSLSFAFPAIPNPLARVYITDMTAPPLFPHQLAIETITGGTGALNASQLYRISMGMAPPFIDYAAGIFGGDGTYKVCSGSALTATAQSDNTTMIRANPNGIIDLANQSRVRAYQMDPNGAIQTIPPNIWVPVNFNLDSPLPIGYDEQLEFTIAPAANTPTPMENSYFTATVSGYYQVNARCEFEIYTLPVMPTSYVSIAIWTGAAPGATASYAIGNNLQIGYLGVGGQPTTLQNNNAPNVSDVIYLMAGQIISIWVYHTAVAPLTLQQGSNKVYVSIHKVS